jgi:hypothetical protein
MERNRQPSIVFFAGIYEWGGTPECSMRVWEITFVNTADAYIGGQAEQMAA